MSWLLALRTRLRLLFARRAAESRMEEEFRFHIEMETERLVRQSGLEPEEARRQALAAFGGMERHKEELRDGRGLGWLSGLSLDLKLGLRMMAKYPGLAFVGIAGIAVSVAICAASFGVISVLVDSTLPLPEGNRIVAIENVDTRASNEARGTYLHDLTTWRESLIAVEELGAYRTINRNLITTGGHPQSVSIAEMTASGFRVARVPPLLGRYFNEADEERGAQPVVVIGYPVWQNRFAGRPDIVGQVLQLGVTRYTIIGVTPPGFAFPVNNTLWTPLRLQTSDFARGHAPSLSVFGRLAPGATLRAAQTQLNAIEARLAAVYPESHQYIQPRVLPYTRSFLDSPQVAWALHLAQLLVSMLVVVIGTNVAILIYARTATRAGEIAVRNALGASRGRIVTQLFAEALVLSVVAAGVGIAGAQFLLQQIRSFLSRMGGANEQLPFWWHFGISPSTALYVAGLAVLAAVIVGVLPALKSTKRQLHSNLQQLGAGGSGMRLGKTWTALIVVQVAVAVAILPLALRGVAMWIRIELAEPAFATTHFLTATLVLDRPELHETTGAGRSVASTTLPTDATRADSMASDSAYRTLFSNLRSELVRRLEAAPGVADVVLSSAVPGNEPEFRMEVDRAATTSRDGATAPMPASTYVGVNRVGPDFFETFDVPMLAGRHFQAGDYSSTSPAVIVNQSFARKMFGAGSPLGRRVRPAANEGDVTSDGARSAPWEEIVGVVPDFPNPADPTTLAPRLYRPLPPGDAHPVTLAVRVRGASPASVADRLRETTVAVSPMLRLTHGVATLDGTFTLDMAVDRLAILAVLLLALSTLLLSAAGVYALMSITVTRRRREIGIRSALGGQPRRLLAGILSRAMGQVAIGIIAGVGMAALLDRMSGGAMMRGRSALLLPSVAALMAAVGFIAAIGPARSALRIQPTEALKSE